VSDPRRRLGQVLAGQPFPAARWELIVGADLYGADALTMSELHALPAMRIGSVDYSASISRACSLTKNAYRRIHGELAVSDEEPVPGSGCAALVDQPQRTPPN
jgi:hypothetical protein